MENSLTIWCFLKKFPCKAECQMYDLTSTTDVKCKMVKVANVLMHLEYNVPDQKINDFVDGILAKMPSQKVKTL